MSTGTTNHPLVVPSSSPVKRTILTDEKKAVILKYLLRGHNFQTCCDMAGILVNTFQKALDNGRRQWQDYEEYDCPLTDDAIFAQQVHRCRAQGDVTFAKKLDDALDKDPVRGWVGAFTRRERERPEQYGRKSTVSIQQDTRAQIIFETRDGMQWQMGNVGGEQRQLPPGIGQDLIPDMEAELTSEI